MTAMTWACALPSTVIGVKHELDLAKMKVGECFYAILGTSLTIRFVQDANFIDHNLLEKLNFHTSLTKLCVNDLNEHFNEDHNDINYVFNNKTFRFTNAAKKERLYEA